MIGCKVHIIAPTAHALVPVVFLASLPLSGGEAAPGGRLTSPAALFFGGLRLRVCLIAAAGAFFLRLPVFLSPAAVAFLHSFRVSLFPEAGILLRAFRVGSIPTASAIMRAASTLAVFIPLIRTALNARLTVFR